MSCSKAPRHFRYTDLQTLHASRLLRRLGRYRILERVVADRLRSVGLALAEDEGSEAENDVARFSSTLLLQSCLKGRISVAKSTLLQRSQRMQAPLGAEASTQPMPGIQVPLQVAVRPYANL